MERDLERESERDLTRWEMVKLTPRITYRLGGLVVKSIKESFVKRPIASSIKTAGIIAMFSILANEIVRRSSEEAQTINAEAYNASLLQKVSDLADRKYGDANGHTLDDEWANLYDSLGLKYDSHLSDPDRDLSTEQRESLLEEKASN